MNINLIWGIVMLIFGVIMFTLGRRSQSKPVEKIEGTTRPLGHGGHGGQ